MTLEDEVIAYQAKLSHDEIIKRFKKVFGREMTPVERRNFFMYPQAGKETTET